MLDFKRRLLIRAAFFVFLCFSVPYLFLAALVTTKEFRDLAEAKVSSFLNAEVSIGRVRVGLFNRIILSDFQVKQSSKASLPGFAVKQIIFRYSLKQLLTRKLTVPSSVILKSPKLSMGANQPPFALIQNAHVKGEGGKLSEFELAGGEIRYEIPVLRTPVLLTDVHATFMPEKNGAITAVIHARLQGSLEGDLQLKGLYNWETKEKSILGKITAASLNRGIVPSTNTFESSFRWINDSLYLDSLRFKLPGKVLKVTGQALNISSQPQVSAALKIKSEGRISNAEVSADFSRQILTGYWTGGGEQITLNGKVMSDEGRISVKEFSTNNRWTGDAAIDYTKGEGVLNLNRDEKRFAVLVRARDNETDLDFKIDHILISGYDVVTSARVHLSSDPFSPDRQLRLDGAFQTDYFVLDTFSLEDFNGDFQLTSSGLDNFSGSWGKVFKMAGNLKWEGGRVHSDLTMRINGFDLAGVKKFAEKPLPKDLGGLLSGKVKIQGPAERPRLIGHLTVKDGWLGKVDFEKAIIQFDGLSPFFKLLDSRVYRGRGTLLITGNIDLAAQNILHAVTFETQDHFVLYRGLDVTLTTDEGDLDLEIHPGIKKLPAIGVKSTGGANTDKDERTKDRFVEIGPRFKF